MKISRLYITIVFSLLCSVSAYAQIIVGVNTSKIIASGVSNKYGINVNAGVDHDSNRAEGAQSLAEAIGETGSKRLRYPGGEKSNYFSWTEDPMNPDPTTNYWGAVYADIALNTLNFDEFMALCEQTGAEAHVNVAVNIWDTVRFTKTLAAEWVRYANISKGYGVKYWEIGNELWHPDKDNEWATLSFDLHSMAALVIDYSNAMKAVDPTIKIGVSWKAHELQQLINLCGSALDFVTISNYTDGGGSSYSDYKGTNNVDLLKVDENLSLNTVISEFNHADWSGSTWDLSNNTGKGLIIFDLIGQILKSAKTEYGLFWNTRWYPIDGIYSENNGDAFNNQNNPLPVVQPFYLWHQFLKDDLVQTTYGDRATVSYAAYDQATGDLNLFLVNKETSAKSVKVTFNSDYNYGSAEVWQYKGADEWDENPTMGQVGSANVSTNLLEYTLPSTSITVFKLALATSANVSSIEDISIYPNPLAGKYMHIKLNSSKGVSRLEIYDVAGRQKFAKNEVNQAELSVDVSTFQEGIYLVRIFHNEGIINNKIMVL